MPGQQMASLVSDRGETEGTIRAVARSSDLVLSIERLAAHLGAARVGVLGPAPAGLADRLDVVDSAAGDDAVALAIQDGIAVVTSEPPWAAMEGARVVVATEHGAGDSVLDAVARLERSATAAGWHVAHSGLLHATSAELPGRREHALLVACRPHDEELLRTLEAGPLSLALDPGAAAAGEGALSAESRPARVLIASYEVSGPTGNGGIGTAYHSLAHVLAGAGHDVTLLFTGWLDPDRATGKDEWRRAFAEEGIAFEVLGTPWDVPVRNPHHAVRRAYELHRWLAEAHTTRPFDVVHVPECQGHGAMAVTAKALGLAYRDVEFVVGTHSSTRWVAEANREGLEDLDRLVTEQLERISVERADVVMSPTAYLLDYMRDRGWSLPERIFVQPLARPQSVRRLAEAGATTTASEPRRELVFFGRLETRKGLEAFCDAVDLLTAADDCPFERITLLGRPERVIGEEAAAYVARRAGAWGVPYEILPDLGHDEAVAYLESHACVVAIPSLVDNSPNTVIEVVALGVPFVASRSGGTGELIAVPDLSDSTFDGWSAAASLEPPTFSDAQAAFDVTALAAALRTKATTPATPVSPAVTDAACDRIYDAWHRAIADRPRSGRLDPAGATPTAAVCLVDCDAVELRRVAGALANGTRPPAHVVAVCDEPIADVPDGVELIVAPGRDAGPARRRIADALESDVLIVLRGNEDPDPALVERVCTAMREGDADVLSLVCRDPDAERRTDTPKWLRRSSLPRDLCAFVPASGPALAAIAYPALSVGPYAIRREALAALGGWSGDLWGEALDRELLSRAALDRLRIDVLPDPLATTVRDDRWAALRARYWGYAAIPAAAGEEQILLLRPYRRLLDGRLADLPAQLVGALRTIGEEGDRAATEVELREQLVASYEARLTEHRDLIELYERQKEEMRAALAAQAPAPAPTTTAGRILRRLRRALRPPWSALPGRAFRFARWRLELLRRRRR
jgi:glycosyltransferase involved in cell wall biosynthesis